MLFRRVSVNESFGTVKWIGFLPDLDSERLGIELDDPSPDRHDGSYKGAKIFDCAPCCGVFVKASKVDCGTTAEAVAKKRYQEDDLCVDSKLVGADKLLKRFSDLGNVHFACLERGLISSAGDLSALVNLARLRLTDNLLSDWSTVIDIVKQLPKLQELDLTGNRISPTTVEHERCQLNQLKTLVLCRTWLPWETVLVAITSFTSLECLNVEECGIVSLASTNTLSSTVTSLNLSRNAISSWTCSLAAIPLSATSLDLSDNALTDVSSNEELESFLSRSALAYLSIAGNSIQSWEFCKTLMDSRVGSQLLGFRVSGNLFYDHPAARQVLIAAFPTLKILNGAPVDKASLRLNAERYTASSREVEKLGFISPKRLDSLRKVHAAPEAVPDQADDCAKKRTAGVFVRIYPLEGKAGKPVDLTVLPSLTVTAFRRLVAKRGCWPLDLGDLQVRWRPLLSENEDELDGSDWITLHADDSSTVADRLGAERLTVLLAVKGK